MIEEWLLETDRRRTKLSFERLQVVDCPEVYGVIERSSPGPGVHVVALDLRTLAECRFTARDHRDASLICGLALDTGDVQQELPEIGTAWLSPEESALFRPSRRFSDYVMPADQTVRGVSYSIEPARLRQALDGALPAALEALFAKRPNRAPSERLVLPADAELRRLARQLVVPRRADPLGGLRREARLLDLLERQLRSLVEDAAGDDGGNGARVEKAAELLRADLRAPPSPRALARAVGLTERQLQVGFRQLLGTTVAAYLRDQRLAHARRRIQAGDAPLGDIAASVGYANASNLIKALRRRYGLAPADLRDPSGGAVRA